MIYFDNSATTLIKPPQVAEAVAYAVNNFGNAGRSFYDSVRLANREVYNTRAEIAALVGLDDPLSVAFTSSATESLNLVIGSLISKDDTVITTVTEHNSVLRPLYLKGNELIFIDCDDAGNLLTDSFFNMINMTKKRAKFLICTHGSNVTGNITETQKLYSMCKENGIIMILDVSQTLGSAKVHISMADIFCFTGHKALFGPQGTGGIIVNGSFEFNVVKTGGAGVNSFDSFQSTDMPDIFEVGTLNSHGIYGLQQGVRFINKTGLNNISAKEKKLQEMFYNGIKNIKGLTIYGDFTRENRLPIVSLNIDGITSAELSERLWTSYGIATRPGSHCAPLLHKRLKTEGSGNCPGMVRLSFSYFNTEEEIKQGISAIKDIGGGCNGIHTDV